MGQRRPRPILACVALGVLAVMQTLLPGGATLPDGPIPGVRRPAPLRPALIAADPAVERTPLFSPDRANGAGQDIGLSLAGVVVARGFASALVRRADGSTTTLRAGDSIDGWRVAAVGPGGAVLTRGPDRRVLRVTAQGPAAAPTAADTEGDDQ